MSVRRKPGRATARDEHVSFACRQVQPLDSIRVCSVDRIQDAGLRQHGARIFSAARVNLFQRPAGDLRRRAGAIGALPKETAQRAELQA